MDVMLQLGNVQFSVPELPVMSTQRSLEYRYAVAQPAFAPPVYTWLGLGNHTLTLKGVAFAPALFPQAQPRLEGGLDEQPRTLPLPSASSLLGYLPPLHPRVNTAIGLVKYGASKVKKILKAQHPDALTPPADAPLEVLDPLKQVKAMAKSGLPYELYDGTGRRLGLVHILGITESGDQFTTGGRLLKMTYDLELAFVEVP